MARSKQEPAVAEVVEEIPEATEPAVAEVVSGFDPSKPFATVHGGYTQASYSQDGIFYDSEGREVSIS